MTTANCTSKAAACYSLAIAIVCVLAFGRVLGDYFVMDDFQLLERVSRTRWWESFRSWPSFEGLDYYWLAPLDTNPAREPAYFRPLQDLTYWLIFHSWRMNPMPYHLVSLLLHIAISLLVFRIALRLCTVPAFAALAGLLFAAHPAHTEAVQWVAALSDPLATLFVLLAFQSWLSAQSSEAPGRAARWKTAGSLMAYGFALLCKESAVALPVLLLATTFLPLTVRDGEPTRKRLVRMARSLWLFWLVTVGYVILHLASTSALVDRSEGSAYVHSVTGPGFPEFALFNYAVYLFNLFLPLPLFPVDARDMFPSTWMLVLAATLLLGVVAVLARLLLQRVSGGVFYALWPAVTLLPVLPIVPGQRFLYMASVGFCWGAALAAEGFWVRRGQPSRLVGTAAAAVLIVYIVAANVFQAFWGIPGNVTRQLATDVLRSAPALPRGSEIYLVNLWAPSVRIPDAIRLEYGDPTLRVEVLSCSPKIIPIREEGPFNPVEGMFCRYVPGECGVSNFTAAWQPDGALTLSLPGGERFGQTLVESMLPTRPPAVGDLVRDRDFTAEVTRADSQGPQQLRFRFNPPKEGTRRLFFEYRGGRFFPMPGPTETR